MIRGGDVGLAELPLRARVRWRSPHELLGGLDALVAETELGAHARQLQQDRGVVGAKRDRLLQRGERLLVATERCCEATAREQRVGVVRREAQDLGERGERLLLLPERGEGRGEQAMDVEARRVDARRAPQRGDGVGGAAERHVRRRGAVDGVDGVDPRLEGALVERGRLGVLAAGAEELTDADRGRGGIRSDGERGAPALERAIRPARGGVPPGRVEVERGEPRRHVRRARRRARARGRAAAIASSSRPASAAARPKRRARRASSGNARAASWSAASRSVARPSRSSATMR